MDNDVQLIIVIIVLTLCVVWIVWRLLRKKTGNDCGCGGKNACTHCSARQHCNPDTTPRSSGAERGGKN